MAATRDCHNLPACFYAWSNRAGTFHLLAFGVTSLSFCLPNNDQIDSQGETNASAAGEQTKSISRGVLSDWYSSLICLNSLKCPPHPQQSTSNPSPSTLPHLHMWCVLCRSPERRSSSPSGKKFKEAWCVLIDPPPGTHKPTSQTFFSPYSILV